MMITLMYHDVYRVSPSEGGFQNGSAFRYKIDSDTFERHVRIVADYSKSKKGCMDFVQFSFDDGGVSAYTVVAPILEKYGYKGLFFISTHYIGTPGFLNVLQIKELTDRGHIIGSHSHTHPTNITEENVDLDLEWKKSRRLLEDIVGPVNTCSIPNGYQSDRVLRSIIDSGYSIVYTSNPSSEISKYGDIEIRGRYGIHNDTTDNDLKRILNSKRYRLKLSVRWSILILAKKILGGNYHWVKQLLLRNK